MLKVIPNAPLRHVLCRRNPRVIPRHLAVSHHLRLYGDHTANRFAATLKQLNIGQGVKLLRVGDEPVSSEEHYIPLSEPQVAIDTIKERLPYVVSIEGDGTNGIDTILACIELKVPIIVALNDFQGQDTDGKIAEALSSQSMSRLIGPGCRSFAMPPAGVVLAKDLDQKFIQGRVGIIAVKKSARGIIASTSQERMGQAVVFELTNSQGGTYTWELLQWMLSDSNKAEVICLLSDNADKETAAVYERYMQAAPENEHLKRVFAMVDDNGELWKEAGMQVAVDEQELFRLMAKELASIDKKKHDTAAVTNTSEADISLTDIPPDKKTA